MTPAVMMVGCSDYEDTEVASPEADADAIGAYLKAVQFLNSCHRGKHLLRLC